MANMNDIKQKKKTLDAELNLIPFINVLAMCICFLLITAVWFQVTSVPVKQSHGTEGTVTGLYELKVDFTKSSELKAVLLNTGAAHSFMEVTISL